MSIYITYKDGTVQAIDDLDGFEPIYENVHMVEDDENFSELAYSGLRGFCSQFFFRLSELMKGDVAGATLFAMLKYDISPVVVKGTLFDYAQVKIAEKLNMSIDDLFITKFVDIQGYADMLEKEQGIVEFRYDSNYYIAFDIS